MPTYPYQCKDCGHSFEIVQSFTDDALTECPECAGNLRKVYSSVGVVFKGSGFYRTDSRADRKGAGSSSGATAASDSSSTSSQTAGSTDGSPGGAAATSGASNTTPSTSAGSSGSAAVGSASP